MEQKHLVKRVCCLIMAIYISGVIQAITYTFVFSKPEYSRTLDEKIKKVMEKIIPGEHDFIANYLIIILIILPFFLLAKRFIKNRAYQLIVPSVLGAIFLIILAKLFTVTWAAPDWNDVLSFRLVLCFVLPYLSMYFSYELFYKLVIHK